MKSKFLFPITACDQGSFILIRKPKRVTVDAGREHLERAVAAFVDVRRELGIEP